MKIKYDIEIDVDGFVNNINRITNQIFKLLPLREEHGDWEATLSNIILELKGLNNILILESSLFLSLICKLEILFSLDKDDDFLNFRKIIFESLSIINLIKDNILKEAC